MAERPHDAEAEGSIAAEPLTAAAFARFGAVIEHYGAQGRYFIPAAFAAQVGLHPHLWVNRLAVTLGPLVDLGTFERHPRSAQNFLPLRGGRWLVVVAESAPGGQPRRDRIRAFVTNAHQGIVYQTGTWHHGLLALDEAAEVAVVMCLSGRDDDTEIHRLLSPVSVRLPPL